jgi:hypothetical protein
MRHYSRRARRMLACVVLDVVVWDEAWDGGYADSRKLLVEGHPWHLSSAVQGGSAVEARHS